MLIAPVNLMRFAVLFIVDIILSYQQFVSFPTLILRMIIGMVSLLVHFTISEPISLILIQLRIV
jgi:hypothetical protein